MSGVVDVQCGGCLVWWMSYFMDGVVDVWCGGCPFLPMVWWMSGVVDVCVVDVVQSILSKKAKCPSPLLDQRPNYVKNKVWTIAFHLQFCGIYDTKCETMMNFIIIKKTLTNRYI